MSFLGVSDASLDVSFELYEDKLADWEHYVPNVPDEVREMMGHNLSEYGSERQVWDEGVMRTEISVASKDGYYVETVKISSTMDAFINFSMASLDDDCSYLIDKMLNTSVVIDQGPEVYFDETSPSIVDYAILDNENITKIAIKNPSAGTVSRVLDLSSDRRKEPLEYVFLATEAFRSEPYYKEVQKRAGKDIIVKYEEFPDEDKQDMVLYLGTTGNDIERLVSGEYRKYKDVVGWAINPFSVMNAHMVHSLVRTEKDYQFEYERKGYTKIELYPKVPRGYRYGMTSTAKYIQKMTGLDRVCENYQLCTKEYWDIENVPDTVGTYIESYDGVKAPLTQLDMYDEMDHHKFGKRRIYYQMIDGKKCYVDSDLPFSYIDRAQYLDEFCDPPEEGWKQVKSVRLSYSSASPLVDNIEAAWKKIEPRVAYEVRCKSYKITKDDDVKLPDDYKEVNKLVVDGVTRGISLTDKWYVYRGSGYYLLYLFTVDRPEESWKKRKVRVSKIEYSMCPRAGNTYLYSGKSSFPSPPYLDDMVRGMKTQFRRPFHYNDFVACRDISKYKADLVFEM